MSRTPEPDWVRSARREIANLRTVFNKGESLHAGTIADLAGRRNDRPELSACESCGGRGGDCCQGCHGNGTCRHCDEGNCPECSGDGFFDCEECSGFGFVCSQCLENLIECACRLIDGERHYVIPRNHPRLAFPEDKP